MEKEDLKAIVEAINTYLSEKGRSDLEVGRIGLKRKNDNGIGIKTMMDCWIDPTTGDINC